MKPLAMSHILLLLTLGSVKMVAANIRGDLGEGWHYFVRGVALRDIQPTRGPRQIIGSRSD